jgi:hypothetical protein
MKIKNIVVSPYDYFKNKSINISRSLSLAENYNYSHDIDYNPNILKLLNLISKIEIKNIIYKYFIFWKKGKK